MRRLDKVDQFHASLQIQKKQLEKKELAGREYQEETQACFAEFDQARELSLAEAKKDLANMESNLGQVEE